MRAAACGLPCEPGSVAAAARQFTGAWPYQQLMAELADIGDALDERVVRAYWTGGALTRPLDREEFGRALIERLAQQAGGYWQHLTDELLPEVAPNHAFHVLGVYPWSRLLDAGMPQPLTVLDSCRIGWAQVVQLGRDDAVVRTRPLEFDGTALRLGADTERRVRRRVEGGTFVDGLETGEWVAVHWDFLCDRLSENQCAQLESDTAWQLERTNERLRAGR